MSNLQIHIIAFDIPYPSDYGGIIDVFYRIKALHQKGVKINLHCFEYNKPKAPTLSEYCENVYYYKRTTSFWKLFSTLPFVVVTRKNKQLLKNLCEDKYPIIFEGLHTCYYLNNAKLRNRTKVVRTQNIEHQYYQALSLAEKGLAKRLYYRLEAIKLKYYEGILKYANHILAINKLESNALSKLYGNTSLLNTFHANNSITSIVGSGNYCLYHGNLSVPENHVAAFYIINKVFAKINTPLIIAGKMPSEALIKQVKQHKHIKIVHNPSNAQMDELVQNAQINLLISFQATGIKLKLINSLFAGRHCIVNDAIIRNTELEKLCTIANTPDEIISAIEQLLVIPFELPEIKRREQVLRSNFYNAQNAQELISLMQDLSP